MRPPFPNVLDSSLIASFRSCPKKALMESLEHWKPKRQSVHLHAGKAYAEGMERTRVAYYVEGQDEDTAIAMGLAALLTAYGDFECPPESAKSAERMAGALEFYFAQPDYRLGQDKAVPMELPGGGTGIEFSFLEPIPEVLHPETGDPMLFAGRMDMMCVYEGSMHLGEDDKTTSRLGASWPRQWDMRSQFTSYVWGAAQAGIKLDGFLVRGVSILKTKYDTLQAITYRPQWIIDRWYKQMVKDAQRMIQCWESGYWDYSLDHACEEYGGCPFRSVCLMREPQALLDLHFEQRRWDPVKRIETVLENNWIEVHYGK